LKFYINVPLSLVDVTVLIKMQLVIVTIHSVSAAMMVN